MATFLETTRVAGEDTVAEHSQWQRFWRLQELLAWQLLEKTQLLNTVNGNVSGDYKSCWRRQLLNTRSMATFLEITRVTGEDTVAEHSQWRRF